VPAEPVRLPVGPESIRLWDEWLRTEDGRRYEAGWGDDENRLRALRGRAWVLERLAVDDSSPRRDVDAG
jgi:hypothetical protein